MIGRRQVVGVLAVGLLAGRGSAHAQAPAKVPRVGYLGGSLGPDGAPVNAQFIVSVLQDLGYVPGRNIQLELVAGGAGGIHRYPEVAARFAEQGLDVVMASNPYGVAAMVKATRTVPIVGIDLESDPVAKGWVASLARPGGNLTGFFLDIPEMSGKQLQFLKEAVPRLARVAVLGDPRINELQFAATDKAARAAGLTPHPLRVTDLAQLAAAIEEGARQRAGGLVALTSPLVFANIARVAELCLKHRIPAICLFVPAFTESGGLLAYGPDFPDLFCRAATYVVRILKGARPAELPVQRPEKFELAVNLKTARALKLTLPPPLVMRADRVIE